MNGTVEDDDDDGIRLVDIMNALSEVCYFLSNKRTTYLLNASWKERKKTCCGGRQMSSN